MKMNKNSTKKLTCNFNALLGIDPGAYAENQASKRMTSLSLSSHP